MDSKLLLLDAGGVLTSSETTARIADEIAARSGISPEAALSIFHQRIYDQVWSSDQDEEWLWERWWKLTGLTAQDLDEWKQFAREQLRDLPGAAAALAGIRSSTPGLDALSLRLDALSLRLDALSLRLVAVESLRLVA